MSAWKYAFRQLAKSPGFTAVGVLTLALGIGVTTAMFSFVNSLLLRPLPFPAPERLVKLFRTTPESPHGALSPADYLDLRRAESAFGRFAGYRSTERLLEGSDQPAEWLNASASFFDVLGVQPKLGRFFNSSEETPGKDRVVVLSNDVWQERFHGERDIIGRTIRSGRDSYQVIGVLPAAATDFRIFGSVGFVTPLSFDRTAAVDRSHRSLQILGRRAAQLTSAQGDAVVQALGAQLAADYPAENAGSGWRLEPVQAVVTGPTGRAIVFLLLGLSSCVLLIACSNLAGVQLARAIGRTRELVVRSALGASRRQLLQPLAAEALILAAAGSAVALIVTMWTTDWLHAVLRRGIGSSPDFPLDQRVLLFAVGTSVLALIIATFAPAVFAFRLDPNEGLRSGARGMTASPRQQRFRRALIMAQFAFAVMLVASAGFFSRGITNLFRQNHGWDASHVVQAQLQLPAGTYDAPGALSQLQRKLVERLSNSPGVQSASVSSSMPYLGFRELDHYVTDLAASSTTVSALINGITPGYFSVTGTRLVAGRNFRDTDTENSSKVAIVSESFARAAFPGKNPLGQRVAQSDSNPREWIEIVGVARDVSSADVARQPMNAQLYQPVAQAPRFDAFLAVRFADANVTQAFEAMRAAVEAIDPQVHLRELQTAERFMGRTTSQMEIVQQLLTAFAGLGLVLAVIGIYGVIAHQFAQRTGEIGIRLAVGARAADVRNLVLRSGGRIAVIGIGLGLLCTAVLARLLTAVLPTMEINAAFVIASAGATLLVAAFAACWIPARRVAKIDPMIALRAD